jgi:hypothetical protein
MGGVCPAFAFGPVIFEIDIKRVLVEGGNRAEGSRS